MFNSDKKLSLGEILGNLDQTDNHSAQMKVTLPEGGSYSFEDTIAYPSRVAHVKVPYLEQSSVGDPKDHLRKMSGAPRLELSHTMEEENARRWEERKELASFLEDSLEREGAIIARPHDWMLAYLPAGPYTESGLHVTLVANPKHFEGHIPVNFHHLDSIQQEQFLETSSYVASWMRATYPEKNL